MKVHIIDGTEYVETNEKAAIDDYVISSEQVGQPRIYKVFHVTSDGLVLGRYSRGHSGLHSYKTLRAK